MKEKNLENNIPPRDIRSVLGTFPWDPMGSYTGRTMEPYEEPVQDADDL